VPRLEDGKRASAMGWDWGVEHWHGRHGGLGRGASRFWGRGE
jgi:hypothetical protein